MAVYTIKRFSADNDRENDERDAEFYDLVKSKRERNRKLFGKGIKTGMKWGGGIGGVLGAIDGASRGGAGLAVGQGLASALDGLVGGGAIGGVAGAVRRHNKNKDLQDLKDQYAVATPEMRKKLIERLKRELAD
jgi:hypothetical protein